MTKLKEIRRLIMLKKQAIFLVKDMKPEKRIRLEQDIKELEAARDREIKAIASQSTAS